MSKVAYPKFLIDYLKAHEAAELATVTPNGKPYLTAIFYYVNSKLEIFFVTLSETKKFNNIQKCPDVAFSVTDIDRLRSFELQGVVSEVLDPAQRMSMIEELAVVQARNKAGWPPPILKLHKGGLKLMCITPTWIRFSDFKSTKEDHILFES